MTKFLPQHRDVHGGSHTHTHTAACLGSVLPQESGNAFSLPIRGAVLKRST